MPFLAFAEQDVKPGVRNRNREVWQEAGKLLFRPPENDLCCVYFPIIHTFSLSEEVSAGQGKNLSSRPDDARLVVL
jgi:hypothetical protein